MTILSAAMRVNAVSPSMIRTGLTSPLLDNFPGQAEAFVANTPLGAPLLGGSGKQASAVGFAPQPQ